MSSQRYERISAHDDNDHDHHHDSPTSPRHNAIPTSPPPSFRSRASSPQHHRHRLLAEHDPLVSDADRTLADTFDSPSDDESEDDTSHTLDARQRVLSGRPASPTTPATTTTTTTTTDRHGIPQPPPIERRVTQLPGFDHPTAGLGVRIYGQGNSVHDGVFANLSAKPERTEDVEEKPPSYEVAAADATPPYWETTILAPGGTHSSDSVFIDGLPVGSVFSFIWNGLISMSFQLVGFLLTYLLHTTHAAKNGSKAGLGITLVQYGFSLKTAPPGPTNDTNAPPGSSTSDGSTASFLDFGPSGNAKDFVAAPPDPNSHAFDPATIASNAASALAAADPAAMQSGGGGAVNGPSGAGGNFGGISASDWLAYALMIVGWFILIRAISEFLKARRHEQLVLQSPARGLSVPIVVEGEAPADTV